MQNLANLVKQYECLQGFKNLPHGAQCAHNLTILVSVLCKYLKNYPTHT